MGKKYVGFGDFFCWNCGERMRKKGDFCPECGVKHWGDDKYPYPTAEGAAGIGWSDKTKHPSFKKYAKNERLAALVWLIGLTIIVPSGLLLSGEISLDGEGRYVIVGVVSIFWLFGLGFLALSRRKKKDWEGVVESKRVDRKTRRTKDSDGNSYNEAYKEYTFIIRRTNGKRHTISWEDTSIMYDYFKEGDRIRYHGSKYLNCLEKYDKSLDTILYCVSCGDERDSRDNFCGKCGTILIKGPSPK